MRLAGTHKPVPNGRDTLELALRFYIEGKPLFRFGTQYGVQERNQTSPRVRC
jgi:hypothetical protein